MFDFPAPRALRSFASVSRHQAKYSFNQLSNTVLWLPNLYNEKLYCCIQLSTHSHFSKDANYLIFIAHINLHHYMNRLPLFFSNTVLSC